MTKALSIFLLLIVLCSSTYCQIWKHPNLPYGFEDFENKGRTELKKGIYSETVIEIRKNDTVSIEECFYDTLGRLKMIIHDGDTLTNSYHNNGSWKMKKSKNGHRFREFIYDEDEKLKRLIEIDMKVGDTLYNAEFKYSNHKLPVLVSYQDRNRTEYKYSSDGRIKELKYYQKNSIRDSIAYSYSRDTIRYSDCSFYTVYDSVQCNCEDTYGLYNDEGKLKLIVSLIPEGDQIIKSISTFEYNERGNPVCFTDSLSNGSYGKAVHHYNKEGYLIKSETFSEGRKIRTMYFTNIVGRKAHNKK